MVFKLILYLQAVDEVNRGHIRADERLYQLKALQDSSKKHKVHAKYIYAVTLIDNASRMVDC
jgi:hypothetical protein